MATKATEEFREAPDLLEQRAFELFSQRSARGSNAAMAEQCFRDAAMFLGIAQSIRSGEKIAAVPEGPQLADASAPNLAHGGPKGIHPINLVSSRFGDSRKIKTALEWLEKNPDPDKTDDTRTEPAYAELGWDRPQTLLAREILPAFAGVN